MTLFWKLFASIGVAMVVTLVAAIYVSYELASVTFNQASIEGREPIIQEAAVILAQGGERRLRTWLREYTQESSRNMVLLIVDENGRELLGRAMPGEVRRLLSGGGRGRGPNGSNDLRGGFDDGMRPSNFRPAQPAPDLIAPGGEAYRLVFTRPLFSVFGVLTWPGTRIAIAGIAILVAALTSMLLARYISAPIMRLQRASRSLAAGVLETRVGSPSIRRSDEVGILARDFDAMAERLQALVTDKETLLRDVSHELRSPLARIRMALVLAERNSDEAAQPELNRIEKETEQLDELIGQILTLARLRTQEEPKREPLQLDEVVAEVVDDARFEQPKARLELEFSAVAPVTVSGDRRGLKSAIENIVRNAMTYAGEDGPIEIQIEEKARWVVVRICDSGSGVEEDDLTRIFEPLHRANKSHDHKTAGQGIGLAIASRVMELHGGQVSARNRTGGGLEVTLELPADS